MKKKLSNGLKRPDNLWSGRYFKKAARISYFLSFLPFIRLIALTGSVAKGKAKKDSDIDLFIVTKCGRIWSARFLVVLFLKIIGQYRSECRVAGKICPNRFHSLDFLKIEPESRYHKEEYSKALPLFDSGEVLKIFLRENGWDSKIKNISFGKFLTESQKSKIKNRTRILKKAVEWLLSGRLGDFMERKLKKYQMNRILNDKRTYRGLARIIIKEGQLCFHPEAR